MTSTIRGSDNFDTGKMAWTNMLSPAVLRAVNTTYTNTDAFVRKVSVSAAVLSGNNAILRVDGVVLGLLQDNAASAATGQLYAEVPPGSTYRLDLSAGTLVSWAEGAQS